MNKLTKEEITGILEEIATLLEIRGENIFKIRAFANAARILDGTPDSLDSLIQTGQLEKIKGIDIGLRAFAELNKKIPAYCNQIFSKRNLIRGLCNKIFNVMLSGFRLRLLFGRAVRISRLKRKCRTINL